MPSAFYFNIVCMILDNFLQECDHLLLPSQTSEFSKITFVAQPNISSKLLLLVAVNEGRGH